MVLKWCHALKRFHWGDIGVDWTPLWLLTDWEHYDKAVFIIYDCRLSPCEGHAAFAEWLSVTQSSSKHQRCDRKWFHRRLRPSWQEARRGMRTVRRWARQRQGRYANRTLCNYLERTTLSILPFSNTFSYCVVNLFTFVDSWIWTWKAGSVLSSILLQMIVGIFGGNILTNK